MEGAESSQAIAKKLERTGKVTLDFFANIDEIDWQFKVYSDGPAWRVHNLLAHLAEVEGSIPRLIRSILEGGGGVSEDFDVDRYNERRVAEMSKLSRTELMESFSERRKNTIDLVKKLEEKELQLHGRHPFLGESKIDEMLRLMMLHNRVHERDIRKALQARNKKS